MRPPLFRTIAAALFAAAAGAADAQPRDTEVPVDRYFLFDDLTVEGGVGKVYSYALAIIVIDDRVALCGVGKLVRPGGASLVPNYLRGSSLLLNGKTILEDFSFWARVPASTDLRKAKATCRLTATPAPAPRTRPEFEFRVPSISYRG